MSLFWDSLELGGDRIALISGDECISYSELVQRVEGCTRELRSQLPETLLRPLVLLEAANEIESIVAYLACLRARWPVILVGAGQADLSGSIASAYAPDLVFHREGPTYRASLAAQQPAAQQPAAMHPELAVLLSTSGTTGAAKLVRLSASNLEANASAISAYLSLSPTDRALTVLPYHYSYGMSVLHTHLRAHAGLVLTDASLVDGELWSYARRHEVTSLALVPTQFELLEKIAFSKELLPTLRYVTQAGGKLDASRAIDFARRAKLEGFEFFIMYGQTEASPRMSYVPPSDAEQWGHSIGRPVEGGSFRILGAAGEEIRVSGEPGELVYEGPNVMLGYATSRADLANPSGPSALKTGDIAERLENGYFRIVGRASRFIKLFGLRIGLDEVESRLRAEGHRAYVSGCDEKLVVFLVEADDSVTLDRPGAGSTLAQDGACSALRTELAHRYQWPERVIEVVPLESVPLLSSGKVDYRELARRAASLAEKTADTPSNLAALLRSVLRTAALDSDKSFVDSGGDSLAYLEVQLFLSRRLGSVPDQWEHLPLGQLLALEKSASAPSSRWQRVSADLICRVVAIVAVIALHSAGWKTGGGSVLLLILVGYSLARFQGEMLFAGHVGKTLRSMLLPLVAIYFVFIAVAALEFSPFDRGWFFLIENFSEHVSPDFLLPYWFVNAYAQIVTLISLPFALAPVRRKVKQAPFESGLIALLAVGLLIQLTGLRDIAYSIRHRHPIIGLELVICGWCMFFATRKLEKVIATAAILLVWMQNYGLVETNIAVLMLGGSLATLWGLQVSVPTDAARGLLMFGSLSMFVYLAHVPALYGLSGFLESGALLFASALVVSLVFALILKKISDLIIYRLVR